MYLSYCNRIGFGKFHEISSLLFRTTISEAKKEVWKDVKYMVFDLPKEERKPYEQRITISFHLKRENGERGEGRKRESE
jgi:hypothetical protein